MWEESKCKCLPIICVPERKSLPFLYIRPYTRIRDTLVSIASNVVMTEEYITVIPGVISRLCYRVRSCLVSQYYEVKVPISRNRFAARGESTRALSHDSSTSSVTLALLLHALSSLGDGFET